MALEKINVEHSIRIAPSPNEADVAIVPINSNGDLGQLNEQVLVQYGYNAADLPDKIQLQSGFGVIPDLKGKPILFVVTIDNEKKTRVLLEQNLYNILEKFKGSLKNKRIWLPLMGTGAGGLTPEESYSSTVSTVNKFLKTSPTNCFFILSFPNSESGRILYKKTLNDTVVKETTIEDFLKKNNCNFYLVGSIWGNDDQSERFFEDKIWEKGHEDNTYSEVIKEISIGDILIIKSTFATQNGGNYLRVKAFGLVTAASQDNASVDVDWKIKGLKIDVPDLSFYRNTITRVAGNDVVTILSLLDNNLWQQLLQMFMQEVLIGSAKIAGLISDSEKGVDYLNISKDVTAFARVITAKDFEPPLAIALFGQWGSGKSFFMRKLRDKIEAFSKMNATKTYCEGIVHIHFNAWSYMDANLWASFVSKIFEGLQEYIKKDNLSQKAINNIKKELSQQLNVTKVGIEVLQNKKTAIEKQIENLETKKALVKKAVEEKLTHLKQTTSWDILQHTVREFDARKQIVEAIETNDSAVKTEAQLKAIIPEKYWDNPREAYEQARSKYTFLKEFFKRENLSRNLIWLGGILIVIFMAPLVLEACKIEISSINFTIPQAGLSFLVTLGFIWKRAEVVYRKLQPIVASFWKIKEVYEEKRSEALAKFEQEEKALTLEIEKGKEEILLFTEQIQKAQIVSADLDYKINNALATETLYSFIEERSQSDDYKKHLGIISTIRKDFEILNGLFIDHNSEIVNQQQAEKFRKYFNNPVERIVLYIDDLDRCEEENVVQVLEAVNLLMAFPLFIVIVGVDPRWVKNALIKKYALQFTGSINGNGTHTGIEQIEPASYLEKIFQIPFHLKDAPSQSVREMIRRLATTSLQPTSHLSSLVVNEASHGYEISAGQENTIVAEDTLTVSMNDEASIESLEILTLSEAEVALMEDMGEIVGPNPRALKRFVNIFKIIKAHEDYAIHQAPLNDDLLAVLFILALSTGRFRRLVASFEKFIADGKNTEQPISSYMLLNQVNELYELNEQLKRSMPKNATLSTIQSIKAQLFNDHYAFIKRFTFKHI